MSQTVSTHPQKSAHISPSLFQQKSIELSLEFIAQKRKKNHTTKVHSTHGPTVKVYPHMENLGKSGKIKLPIGSIGSGIFTYI